MKISITQLSVSRVLAERARDGLSEWMDSFLVASGNQITVSIPDGHHNDDYEINLSLEIINKTKANK